MLAVQHGCNTVIGTQWATLALSSLQILARALASPTADVAAAAAAPAGGLPDLLLWRPCDHSAKCVEVKGPRDRLSNQQRFWLAHMASSNMAVEVCKVREPPATSRSRQ
jgi:Fanconi-associated nuclease 1